MALVFGKLYLFIKAVCQAVDPYPDKALFTEIFEQFPVFTFFAINERGQQNDLVRSAVQQLTDAGTGPIVGLPRSLLIFSERRLDG